LGDALRSITALDPFRIKHLVEATQKFENFFAEPLASLAEITL